MASAQGEDRVVVVTTRVRPGLMHRWWNHMLALVWATPGFAWAHNALGWEEWIAIRARQLRG